MKIESLVKKITDKLKVYDINFEVTGDKHTFAIAQTCSILTESCTIDIVKDQMFVNDKLVSSVEELIEEVLNVELVS